MSSHRDRGMPKVDQDALTDPPELVRSVYVHAPFCARRCFYCDFAVSVSRTGDLDGWLGALEWELGLVEEEGYFSLGEELRTLFVGGGTPSVCGPEAMAGLVRVLGRDRLKGPDLEWTAEANPESFTSSVADGWGRAGVNRVSLGVQSFQAPALRWLRRLHGPEEPAVAIKSARTAGIENLNVDLIFGLPKEVERDWGLELDAALALGIPHLSLYGLSVEKETPLARAIEQGEVSLPDEEDYREQFITASERLTAEGYRHYEVSNFARPGFEARHNRVYWELLPYLGLGNSAHSFRAPRRRWNLRNWNAYQEANRDGALPWDSEEELTAEDARLERIWLGLRNDRGIRTYDLEPEARGLVEGWVAKWQAIVAGGVVRLTPEGWLLLDHLVVELDLALGEVSY
ncbi:MAG: radical SAM family heme chaperone HemW [Gemmatimonadales bacterium]|nr:MAG: radical SAM family heme chaperone HemW [Gemmatimonadales bacterium]